MLFHHWPREQERQNQKLKTTNHRATVLEVNRKLKKKVAKEKNA
jgi:hypothetical protein